MLADWTKYFFWTSDALFEAHSSVLYVYVVKQYESRCEACWLPQDHLHLPHGGPDGHGRDHANRGDNLAVPVHCWKNQTRRRVQVEQKE